MPEQKKSAQKPSDTAAMDWAERLKAAMNADNTPETDKAPVVTDEDDELAALLRAQLARRTAEPAIVLPDTSDFEVEPEESLAKSDAESFEADNVYEEEESPSEEYAPDDSEPDEYAQEEYAPDDSEPDEYVQDEYAPDDSEPDEYMPEEYAQEDSAEEDNLAADAPAESAPEMPFLSEETEEPEDWAEEDDIPEEDNLSDRPFDAEDPPMPLDDGVSSDEAFPDEVFFEEESVSEVPSVDNTFENACPEDEVAEKADFTVPVTPPRPVTDDRLNGLGPREAPGGRRLQALSEENIRVIAETAAVSTASYTAASAVSSAEKASGGTEDSHPQEADTPDTDRTAAEGRWANQPEARPVHDPLQTGLEGGKYGSATASVRSAPLSDASDARKVEAAGQETYVASMPADGEAEQERDTELYLRLGYEDKLSRTEEQARAERVRDRARVETPVTCRNETVPADRGREYTDRSRTDAVDQTYRRTKRHQIALLAVTLVGTLFAVLYDLLPMVADIPFIDSWVYPLVELGWMIAVCLPLLPRLGRGLRSLWDFEPTRYAVSALGLIVTAIHSVVACLATFAEVRLFLFGSVALLMTAVAVLSEYLTTVGEHAAFSVASCGKPAYVLTDEMTPAAAVYRDRAEKQGETVRIFSAVRTGRVADYFARTGRYNPYMGRLNYLLPAAFAAAILTAGAAILMGGDILADGVRVFTATYLACLPATYLVAMSLPLARVNGKLVKRGCAVIGTAAPADYGVAAHTRLVIRDGDALHAGQLKEITLRGDADTAEWRRMAAVLFRLLDCPLATDDRFDRFDRFDPLQAVDIAGIRAEFAEAGKQYIKVYLTSDGRGTATEVMMGSYEALTRRGVKLPRAEMERMYKKSEASQVLYLAFDRRFRLAYAVEYRVARSFVQAVEAFAAMGYATSVVTYDPLVEHDLLKVARLQRLPAVELVRPARIETPRKSRSGALLATGRSVDLLYPVAACHRMKKAYRRAHLAGWLTLLLGFGLSFLSAFWFGGALLSAATVTVWQCIPAAVMTIISLASTTDRGLYLAAPGGKAKGTKVSSPGEADRLPAEDKPAAPHSAKKDKINKE